MTGYRADRQKLGKAGRPQKSPPVHREDVGTRTVVQGKGVGVGEADGQDSRVEEGERGSEAVNADGSQLASKHLRDRA